MQAKVVMEVTKPSMRVGRQKVALALLWAAFVVLSLLLLPVINSSAYGIVIPVGALALLVVSVTVAQFRAEEIRWGGWQLDRGDLLAIAAFFTLVVALFKIAFGVFTTGNIAGLFLTFGAGLLVGVVGPVGYTVWVRHRPLASLGFGTANIRSTITLGLIFAAAQFSVTLLGYRLPAPVDWIPLLFMQITVGFFEAVFFRGFIQATLERSIGVAPAVALAAALYAVYHFGYGMTLDSMLFLFGLGLVYTIAYRITSNLLIIWPLLTPLGGFFSQLQRGELSGQLPWLSMAGFADILLLMAVCLFFAWRKQRGAQPHRTLAVAH